MNPKQIGRALLERSGYLTTPVVSQATLADFLARLRPFETDKPLIRVGAEGDGGYLVPDDLSGIEYCFSPGVSTVSIFEEALLERGIKSFLADASVDRPPATLRDFVFDKKFLGSFDDDSHFTLSHWINKYLPDAYTNDLILQMDIEGSEYPVLIETPSATLKKFRIIVVEFHFVEQLINAHVFGILSEAFQKLLDHFTIVHIHPNNKGGTNRQGELTVPNLLEITFLRKDRISRSKPATRFPHPLDRRNFNGRSDCELPHCWYK